MLVWVLVGQEYNHICLADMLIFDNDGNLLELVDVLRGGWFKWRIMVFIR